MAQGVPVTTTVVCPREKVVRLFRAVDGQALYACTACEWTFTLGTQSPTGTINAAATAGSTSALGVASGGASFTNGMYVLVDTATGIEVVQVSGTPTGTSIPLKGAVAKSHNSGAAIGQLLVTPASHNAGQDAVPNPPGWGF